MANQEWAMDVKEAPVYLDGKPFKKYARAIEAIIKSADSPVSIREIHLKLGDDKRPSWTADALESLVDIEPVGILPTRYWPRNVSRRPDPKPIDFLRNYPVSLKNF